MMTLRNLKLYVESAFPCCRKRYNHLFVPFRHCEYLCTVDEISQMFALVITTLSVLFCGISAKSLPRDDVDSVDHLLVLARHGERYPLFPVPELGDFVVSVL